MGYDKCDEDDYDAIDDRLLRYGDKSSRPLQRKIKARY